MSRVYLAGPMTGYSLFNYPAFAAAAAALRETGLDVVSPHEINPAEVGFDHEWAWYMRRDLAELLTAESVVALPGWEQSKGASLEVHIARALGMPILLLAEALGRAV